jgi:hypothetical protein
LPAPTITVRRPVRCIVREPLTISRSANLEPPTATVQISASTTKKRLEVAHVRVETMNKCDRLRTTTAAAILTASRAEPPTER